MDSISLYNYLKISKKEELTLNVDLTSLVSLRPVNLTLFLKIILSQTLFRLIASYRAYFALALLKPLLSVNTPLT